MMLTNKKQAYLDAPELGFGAFFFGEERNVRGSLYIFNSQFLTYNFFRPATA
jgi:hypothetical protein